MVIGLERRQEVRHLPCLGPLMLAQHWSPEQYPRMTPEHRVVPSPSSPHTQINSHKISN